MISTTTSWKFDWLLDWSVVSKPDFSYTIQQLASKNHNGPFFHPSVTGAWLETFGGKDDFHPSFLLASKDSTEIIWPFVRKKTDWKQAYLRKLQPIGQRLFDYHDPLTSTPNCLDREFWLAFSDELRERGSDLCDQIEIPRIRCEASTTDYFEPTSEQAPYADLSGFEDGESFLQTRKGSLRGDVRRQIKRLSKLGHLQFQVYDKSNLSAVLAWIPRLEQERQKRYGTALPENYLANLAIEGLKHSVVHCSTMNLDGKPISWHIGFHWNNVFYWYIPIYDSAIRNLSPGKVHLYYAIDWAIRNGCKTFDFLRGTETYKTSWTDGGSSKMVRFSLNNPSFASMGRRRFSRLGIRLGYLNSYIKKIRPSLV